MATTPSNPRKAPRAAAPAAKAPTPKSGAAKPAASKGAAAKKAAVPAGQSGRKAPPKPAAAVRPETVIAPVAVPAAAPVDAKPKPASKAAMKPPAKKAAAKPAKAAKPAVAVSAEAVAPAPAQPASKSVAKKVAKKVAKRGAREGVNKVAEKVAENGPEKGTEKASRRGKPARSAKPAVPVDPVAAETAQAVLAVLTAEPEPAPAAAPTAAPVAAPRPTGPAHSALALVGEDRRAVVWQPGHACPPVLQEAAARRLDADGHLPDEDDTALPLLLRLAAEAHHPLQVSEAVWAHRAAHRDARHRLGVLESAYPDGPASLALQRLLRAPLPLFQAEGALFAVVAGRALLADERGLGKGVQAIAAALLWQRHFGVQRVLVLCAPAQRLAWQRAWQRFAGDSQDEPTAQVIDGGLHQRQAQWSAASGVRIIAPDALDSDAAHLAHWAPDLVIVDEPQGLGLHSGHWAALQSPHALVLCGAPLAEEPELMHTLVAWLDEQRLGPLAALVELQTASDTGRALTDADVERLTGNLSRLMLQRLRADLADQLPALVHTERLVSLAPGQRSVHEQQATIAQRALAGWRASGYLSDTDQWRLASALRAMQQACHRADPADAASALAESTLQALSAQLAEWAGTGAGHVAVLCPAAADQALLAERLAPWLQPSDDGLQVQLIAPGDPLPGGLDAVLQVGVPWRPRRNPAGPRGEAAPGQQWVYLVAQDSVEAGLFDTLAGRSDAPRGLDDAGSRDYLHGQPLAAWLQAVQAALPMA